MDHEVVLCSSKILDWPLTRPKTTLVDLKKINVRVTMEFVVRKRPISALHYPMPWSNIFCNERGKRGSLATNVKGLWQGSVVLMHIFCHMLR